MIADAQIELGRYGDAARTLQHWIDLRPGLSSYARVSYFRELHGDLQGALEAMNLAVAAGGDRAENLNYVETLAGNLAYQSGDYASAERTYRGVLARAPDYAPGLAGLGRAVAAQGELGEAIRHYRRAVEILPLPEHSVALGEAELAAGRKAAARRDLALVDLQIGCCATRGPTRTSSWRSSRPTTATRRGASSTPARRGARRRASAPRTPSPGPSTALAATRRPLRTRARR